MEEKMNKIKNSTTGTVIKFEFIRQIKKPSFWISIILIPILMFGVGLFSYLISSDTASIVEQYSDNSTIAIVDEANLLPEEAPFLIDGDLNTGVTMVKNQTVDLFFYIPADFATTKNIEFYHISEGIDIFSSESNTIKAILANTYLRISMSPSLPPLQAISPSQITL